MKRILFLLAMIVLTSASSWCANWCEALVNRLRTRPEVNSSIAVYRDSKSKDIVRATYEFKFTSGAVYNIVLKDMQGNAAGAEYFSEKGKGQKEVMMRFVSKGKKWSCRLRPLEEGNNQFLVNVSMSDGSVPVEDLMPATKPATEKKDYKTKTGKTTNQEANEAVEQNNSELRKAKEARRRRLEGL